MFKSLKEKLKGWISKTKEEVVEEAVEEPVNEEEKSETKENKKKKAATKKKEVKKHKKNTNVAKKVETTPKKEVPSPSEEVIEEKVEETVVEEEAIAQEPEKEDAADQATSKKSFFSRFKRSLSKEKFDESFEELELILLQNNVAYAAVEAIKQSLEEKLVGESASVDIAKSLTDSIEELLINPPNFLDEIRSSLQDNSPYVILFSGINGSGKTTTIAKVANYLKENGHSVCLAAADTFRAASIEQIAQHAKNLDVPLIKKDYGSDPASVGFDAVAYAKKHKIEVVLIDTAGRMQNKDSLMREIEKIARVAKPHMKIFLGESITGNDATEQAKSFNEAIGLTGIILSKADVDEKGGTAISVSHVTQKPILFLGVGQEYKDLEVFDKSKLIEKIRVSLVRRKSNNLLLRCLFRVPSSPTIISKSCAALSNPVVSCSSSAV